MAGLREGVAKALKDFVETNRMTQEEFDQLVALDTSDNKKYIEWMCRIYVREHPNMERFSIIATFIDLTRRNIITGEDKDIGKYRTLEALDDKVRQHEGTVTRSQQKRGVKNFEDIPERDIAFQNDKCVVVLPTTTEDSIRYGRGTRWCTAAMGNRNYFDDYRNRKLAHLYYILPKIELGEEMGLPPVTSVEQAPAEGEFGPPASTENKDPNRKYDKIAIAVYTNASKEFYDYFDNRINQEDFSKLRAILEIP